MSNALMDSDSEAAIQSVRWWQRKDVKAIFWLWLVLTIVGISFCWVPAWLMGPSASLEMDMIKLTMTMFTALAMPVGAVIWAIMIFSLMKWRYKGDGPPPDDAPGFTTNAPTVIIWTVLSGILTLVVFVWGLLAISAAPTAGAYGELGSPGTVPMTIEVTGNQWVWNFTYPEAGGIQSDILYLPVNQPVDFSVTSVDVIHSFWIVEMGIKVDANPGAVTYAEVTPNREGTFEIRCAELCGILHAAMETQAEVLPQEEFDVWVAGKQLSEPVLPAIATEEEEGH